MSRSVGVLNAPCIEATFLKAKRPTSGEPLSRTPTLWKPLS
jgi:hypothetical protein